MPPQTSRKVSIAMETDLLERLDSAAAGASMSRQELIREALNREVKRMETERLREEIAALEIEQQILEGGQALEAPLDQDLALDGRPLLAHCELCSREIAPAPVEGPIFCKACLEIARGADFSTLDAEV